MSNREDLEQQLVAESFKRNGKNKEENRFSAAESFEWNNERIVELYHAIVSEMDVVEVFCVRINLWAKDAMCYYHDRPHGHRVS